MLQLLIQVIFVFKQYIYIVSKIGKKGCNYLVVWIKKKRKEGIGWWPVGKERKRQSKGEGIKRVIIYKYYRYPHASQTP